MLPGTLEILGLAFTTAKEKAHLPVSTHATNGTNMVSVIFQPLRTDPNSRQMARKLLTLLYLC